MRRCKLKCKRPCWRRASKSSGRSIKRMLQPRYAVPLRTGDVGDMSAEPLQRRRRLLQIKMGFIIGLPIISEGTTTSSYLAHRGTGGDTKAQICEANWGATRRQPIQVRRAKTRGTKKISPREMLSVSDETIVSDDPGGQHNLWESQGALD